MRAGELRERVTIRKRTQVREYESGRGDMKEVWETIFENVPAQLVALSGDSLIAAQAVQSQVNTRGKIRYMPGVTAEMQILHECNVYIINAVLPDPTSRDYLTLMLISGVGDGL